MPKDSNTKHSHSSRSSGQNKSRKESTSNGHDQHYHRSRNVAQHDGVAAPLSFLFVVNEVRATQQTLDSWGSKCPPEDAGGYGPEVPSKVMHYINGAVQAVGGYTWYRARPGVQGGIGWYDGNGAWNRAEEYATATVFSCHPLMPVAMVNTDATATNTTHRGSESSYYYGTAEDHNQQHVWQPLLFFHPPVEHHLRGVSQVVFQSDMTPEFHGGSPVKYVAGRGQLMKSLTPETYRYPGDHPPDSRGLGGNLAALLGLMALHSPPAEQGRNRAETAIPRKWQANKWRDDRPPHLRDDLGLPSGVVIVIALDPANPMGSTREALRYFEFHCIPIME